MAMKTTIFLGWKKFAYMDPSSTSIFFLKNIFPTSCGIYLPYELIPLEDKSCYKHRQTNQSYKGRGDFSNLSFFLSRLSCLSFLFLFLEGTTPIVSLMLPSKHDEYITDNTWLQIKERNWKLTSLFLN